MGLNKTSSEKGKRRAETDDGRGGRALVGPRSPGYEAVPGVRRGGRLGSRRRTAGTGASCGPPPPLRAQRSIAPSRGLASALGSHWCRGARHGAQPRRYGRLFLRASRRPRRHRRSVPGITSDRISAVRVRGRLRPGHRRGGRHGGSGGTTATPRGDMEGRAAATLVSSWTGLGGRRRCWP